MAYVNLGSVPQRPAVRMARRGHPYDTSVMKVWKGAPPNTPIWQNRATSRMPHSGSPGWPVGVSLAPEHYQSLAGVDDGLGFSLKPPKWVRKLTLKKAIKPLAIAAGVLLIPGAAPLIAKGLLGAGKLAFGGVKLAGKGVTGLVKLAGKNVSAASTVFNKAAVPKTAIAPQMDVSNLRPDTAESATVGSNIVKMLLPQNVAQGQAQAPNIAAPVYQAPTYGAPSINAAFTPGSTAPTAGSPYDVPTAEQAGMGGSSLVPLAVAGAALLAVTMMSKGRR